MIEFTIAPPWEDVLAGAALYMMGAIITMVAWGFILNGDLHRKAAVVLCSLAVWPVFWTLFLVGCALRIPIAVSRSMKRG